MVLFYAKGFLNFSGGELIPQEVCDEKKYWWFGNFDFFKSRCTLKLAPAQNHFGTATKKSE